MGDVGQGENHDYEFEGAKDPFVEVEYGREDTEVEEKDSDTGRVDNQSIGKGITHSGTHDVQNVRKRRLDSKQEK